MVIAVVLPKTPPVPMFNVLVRRFSVAPVLRLNVLVFVDWPIIVVLVCAVPPIVSVPLVRPVAIETLAVVVKVANDALFVVPPVSASVPVTVTPLRLEFVPRTTEPVPVFVENSVRPTSQSAAFVLVVPIHFANNVVPAGTDAKTVSSPLDLTRSVSVELLQSENVHPVSSVDVTGSTIVWARVPVKI